MKITAEILALASKEISQKELEEFAFNAHKIPYLQSKAVDVATCIMEGKDPLEVILVEIIIALLVGIKVGKKEATTELTQVR